MLSTQPLAETPAFSSLEKNLTTVADVQTTRLTLIKFKAFVKSSYYKMEMKGQVY